MWQKSYDPALTMKEPSSFYNLAEPAAIWTLFKLEELDPHRLHIKSWLDVKDWQSYAYFRVGVYWRLRGDNEKARQMFLNALRPERDPENQFAWLNLGIIDTEEESYERALERLNRARETAKKYESEPPKDVVWYKATYQLAATYLYSGYSYQSKGAFCNSMCCFSKAQRKAEELASNIKYALNQSSRFGLITINTEKLNQFLKSIKLMVLIMQADILVCQGDIRESKSIIDKVEKDEQNKLSYRDHYNLACYFSNLGDRERTRCQAEEAYNKALSHLEYAFEAELTLRQWAQKDPSLKAVRENKQKEFEEKLKN